MEIEKEEIAVSVICRTYNHEKYIGQCLESLVSQKTSFKYEIIVYDDASLDNTANIVREYEKQYSHLIKPIYQEINQCGKKITFNLLIPQARGRYIAFCEGDDFWCDEKKLQTQYDILENNSDCSMCTHIVEKVQNNGEALNEFVAPINVETCKMDEKIFFECFFKNNLYPFQTTSYFIRKHIFDVKPDFLYAFSVGDIPMLLLSILHGNIFYLAKRYSCWRQGVKGSYNDRLKNIEYSTKQICGEYQGWAAFNAYTQCKYYQYIDVWLNYLKLQYYYIHKKKPFKKREIMKVKKNLPVKLKIKARIKHSAVYRFYRKNFKKK